MSRTFALALAFALLSSFSAANAEDTLSQATVADVRCVVVASIMGNDAANAQSAALISLYYLGRLDGREPASFDLSQAMLAQIKVMSPADFSAEGKRCGKQLEGRAVYMADVGKRLTDQKPQQ